MSDSSTKHSIRSLLATPKGNLIYTPGDAFILHVFWEAPSMAAARELLSGLQQCATATHRDTPCVPTYLFRISNNDTYEMCSPPPRTLNDHPHVRSALKKLQVGVPPPAIRAELVKRRLDPNFVDLDLDTELPQELQSQPVRVECTEIYLDERAFMEHVGSRDYLDGYAVVMNPAMHYTVPMTIRLGTPPASLVESLLEPVLNERAIPLPEGTTVWRQHQPSAEDGGSGVRVGALFLSLDVDDSNGAEDVVAKMAPSGSIRDHCTTFVAFAHPLREGTTRIMAVFPTLPPPPILASLAALQPARGEVHMQDDNDQAVETIRSALLSAGLGFVTVNASECVGYVLHAQAASIREKA